LGGEVRRPKMLLCYDYWNGIIDEEENIIFATKPKLFSIETFNLLKIIQSMKIADVEIINTNVKTTILEHEFEVQNTKKKIDGNRYEPKIVLEDKVYSKMYYCHQLGNVAVDETLIKIKAQEL
jgi:hypothetical protein